MYFNTITVDSYSVTERLFVLHSDENKQSAQICGGSSGVDRNFTSVRIKNLKHYQFFFFFF